MFALPAGRLTKPRAHMSLQRPGAWLGTKLEWDVRHLEVEVSNEFFHRVLLDPSHFQEVFRQCLCSV